jgi:hypothetical protein
MVRGLLKTSGLQELVQTNCRCPQLWKEHRYLYTTMTHHRALNTPHSFHECFGGGGGGAGAAGAGRGGGRGGGAGASPSFGSDVAANTWRASLRFTVLQFPVIAFKMSTALEE